MAVNIKLKRSAVPGQAPTTAQLELGEIALNTHDGKAFFKQDNGTTQSIIELASTSGSSVASASYALYAENANLLDGLDSSVFTLTSSFQNYTASANTRLDALNAATASINNFSASINSYTASQNILNGKYATTGSNVFEGVQTINSNLIVTGSITAQTLFVQTITSSVNFVTGSTKFGTLSSNTHQFTGSVSISGSLGINGVDYEVTSASFDNRITINSGSIAQLSASLLGETAAIYTILFSQSASIDALSSSFLAFSGSYNTGSFIGSFTGSFTGSLEGTASHALFSDFAVYTLTSSFASTASFVKNANSASYAGDYTLTSSFQSFTQSYYIDSASVSTRVENLELFSSSLDATFATDTQLNFSSSVLSGSISVLSASFLNVSSSNSTRISDLEQFSSSLDTTFATDAQLNYSASVLSGSTSALSASFLNVSASNSTRIYDLEAFSSSLDTIYATDVQLNTSSSILSGSISALSASFLNFSSSLDTVYATDVDLNNLSASFKNYTSSINNWTGSSTSQFGGTSSFANNATSASYARSASFVSSGTGVFSGSFSGSFFGNGNGLTNIPAASIIGLNLSQIASGSVTASVDPAYGFKVNSNTTISGSTQITGSLGVTGSVSITGSGTVLSANVDAIVFTGSFDQSGSVTVNGNIVSTGTITAQTLIVQTITSSTDFVTGSTRFGTITSNTHQFTGSVSVSGSLAVNGVDYTNLSSSFNTRILNNSSSIGLLSGSYLASSASFDTRILNTSSSVGLLSSSYLASSASFDIRILNNSSSVGLLSGSYLASSASFDTRILVNSSSIGLLSSSFLNNSASNSTRISNLEAFSSSLDSTYATDAQLNYSASVLSGSISALSASYTSFTTTYNTGSFTGSFNGTFSGSLDNLRNSVVNHIPYFSSSQILADSTMFQVDNGNGAFSIAINQNGVTTAAPEALYVFQPSTSSYNVISGKGNLNSYLQLNIQNVNNGANASSDVVATANNGDETTNFIDMGINGANFTGPIGDANDAYLYSTGQHLHIGNATAGQYVGFFAGGDDVDTNMKLILDAFDQHQITGSLDVSGSVKAFNFTGSLLGTASFADNATSASYALSASYASAATSASYSSTATSASYALSASYSSTATSASYSSTATSASYAVTASSADNFLVRGTLTAQTINVQTITSSVEFVTGSTKSGTIVTNTHQFTGSVTISGSLAVNDSNVILTNQTSSMSVATASYAQNAQTASFVQNAQTASYVLNAISASYAANADLLDGKDSTTFATTGSNTFIGTQIVTGSLFTSGSNTLIGNTQLTGSIGISGSQTFTGTANQIGTSYFTGSINITGSTTQVGNNNLFGNTTLSGSIIISGSHLLTDPSIKLYGDTETNGAIKFLPVTDTIDPTITGSYVYVSGSTQDLYFTQNGNGYANTTRLRWLEGNLYTGLLNGGLITAATGSTTFNLSSGSGIVVNLNASINNNPYPTIKYVNWGNFTSQSLTYLTSSIQTFIGIDDTGNIFQQNTAFNDGQYNTLISIGTVLHQNKSTVNASITYPNVAYGWKQRSYDFVKAFGPLKLSGLTINTSSSLGLTIGSGTAFADGRNYQIDPNNPSYIIDPGTSVSKIFRYWQSGSEFVQDTNAGVGYTDIDPTQYNSGSALASVSPSTPWTNQRVFWYPNSATKGIVVYYGKGQYASSTEALANLATENFLEVENTKQNAVYLGAITIKYNGVFTTPADYIISPAGIFRSIGGSGGGGTVVTTRLVDLSDVSALSATSGQALVYDTTTNKWENKSYISASISGNATTSVTASYASTASFVTLAQTASFVQNAQTASYWSGSIINAVSASYAASASIAVSASYATSSAYAANANIATYAGNIALLRDTTDTTLYPVFSAGTAADAYTSLRGNPSGALSYNATNFVLTLTSGSVVAPSFTGSLSGTASFANNATSASYAANATSASYANNSTTSSYANVATSASYADNATSASHALTSSYSNNILGVANYIPKFTGDNTLSSSIMYENASGIGINDTSATHKLQVSGDGFIYNSNSTLNTTKYALLPALNVTTTGTETNQWANVSLYGSLGYSATTGTFTPRDNSYVSAFLGNVAKSGGGNVTGKMSSFSSGVGFSGAGNVTTFAGFRAYAPLQSYALPAFTGTLTNYIGLLIDDINGTTDIGSQITNRYGIFQSGSLDKNYFAGSTTFANGITGSLLGTATTASYVLNAVSASNAATSSYSQNLTVGSTLIVDQTLTDYATIASSIVGSNNLFTQNTGSYTSAFFKYTVSNGGSTRAGEVIAAWNGTTTELTDFSTVDIGNTSAVTASISILSGQVQFNVQTNTSGWRIKSLATFM